MFLPKFYQFFYDLYVWIFFLSMPLFMVKKEIFERIRTGQKTIELRRGVFTLYP